MISKPEWLRIVVPSGNRYSNVKRTISTLDLHTVCQEARCPNIAECWGSGTATIMIMGDLCTRHCRFCAVKSGNNPALLDTEEPVKVAKAIRDWGLKYVVITCVCRDDLEDGGAGHISDTIKAIKLLCPKIIVEPLIPDFQGNDDSIIKIVNAHPEVISHNIETVLRLSAKIRDSRASYSQSLRVLKKIKEFNSKIFTKSSIMIGIGETEEEVIRTALDLRSAEVDVLTIGQYLQPTYTHLPIAEYVSPEKFKGFQHTIERMGFKYVAAGPLIRSSYRAGEFFLEKIIRPVM
jgi:lipoic acid synthetase